MQHISGYLLLSGHVAKYHFRAARSPDYSQNCL